MEVTSLKGVKVVGFDADDTLWVNETFFRAAEQEFAALFSMYETPNKIEQLLFAKQVENLPLYGYGVKGFVLSMIESALEISNQQVSPVLLDKIVAIGKQMLQEPVVLLPGVEEILRYLQAKQYRLMVFTKGDLLDQERKIAKSGLSSFFQHVEVMSDKKPENYKSLLRYLDIPVSDFVMVGNSLRSDVLPLLEIGAKAVHIPFHTTWKHEMVPQTNTVKKYLVLDDLLTLKQYL